MAEVIAGHAKYAKANSENIPYFNNQLLDFFK